MTRNNLSPKLFGVCSWIAGKLSLDVNIVRIGFVVLTILGVGSPVLVYLIIAILLHLGWIE
jgi:phage shock protein C